MKKVFKTILVMSIVLFGSVEAQTLKPSSILIDDNDQVTVSVSNRDINRLFVDHEKITAINTPSGVLSAHNDASGSIYANIDTEKPFTAFLTTNTGRHFSVLMVPKAEPGKTLEFKPKHVFRKRKILRKQKSRRFERSQAYETIVVKIIRDVMRGNIPPGFTVIPKRAFYSVPRVSRLSSSRIFHPEIQALYLGGDLAVRVVHVENTSKNPLTLTANQFYQKGVRAVAIEKEQLPPNTATRVIEVVQND